MYDESKECISVFPVTAAKFIYEHRNKRQTQLKVKTLFLNQGPESTAGKFFKEEFWKKRKII